MAKHCETFDHPADVGLAAKADTLGELFEALAEGLAEVICPRRQVARAETRWVSAAAEDLEALAVDFLSEVMAAIQEDHFMVTAVQVEEISDRAVTVALTGEPYDPARHEIKIEVKAVTYHQLLVAREDGGWAGRVILDL
ncbi:MAG: archease, partial [Phycisphaerae bacterium]|nr:archease [Phycisphaerae bacterium]